MNMNILNAQQLVIMESLLIGLRRNSFLVSNRPHSRLSPFRAGMTMNRKIVEWPLQGAPHTN